MLVWSQEYSVNNSILDDQHKKLFMILNKISDIVQQGAGNIFYPLAIELESYTIFHFSMEEHELEEANFPNLESHRQEHQKFKDKISELKEKAFGLDTKSLLEIHAYLKNWIKNHIMVLDKQYVPYLEAAKGQPGEDTD
jgi:hemerythrin